jgi:two-component system sensor histidine kinase GlrK
LFREDNLGFKPLLRPRSINGLIVLGFGLVTLPLLVAIAWAAYQMDRLARDSEVLVLVGVEATRLSQEIVELIPDLERTARLYSVLGNADLVVLYQKNQDQLLGTIDTLTRLSDQANVKGWLAMLSAKSTRIAYTLSRDPVDQEALTAVLTEFPSLESTAREVAAENRRLIDDGLNRMKSSTRQARQVLAWLLATLIPGTLALVILFVSLVTRPIRQIDRVIRELGRGAFSRPIKVSGPSDLESLGHQLEWLRVRLLELAQEKNRFLRHMSHELKTPLANIREGTELLLDGSVGPLDEGQKEVATILQSSGVKLQKDIENLLSFSAWQSRTASLELSEFPVKPLLHAILRQHALALTGKRIIIEEQVDDVILVADKEKVRIILDNLLSNATKFAPPGSKIFVTAHIEKDQLNIDVADCGPGIPREEREKIFHAFYQGSARQSGHVKGTGIGLSVVLECVTAHGGTVEILDGQYPGAHFRIHLPMDQVAEHE